MKDYPTFPQLLVALIKVVMPAVTEERIAEILARRAHKSPDPIYSIISHEDLMEVSSKDDYAGGRPLRRIH